MNLTAEQRAATEVDDSTYLVACPGSGKTRVIISKLARCLDELTNSTRKVACITYTNAAVHEIESRLRQQVHLGVEQSLEICTIHSFCLNHIFRSRCHEFTEYRSGFELVTQDSDEFRALVELTRREFGKRSDAKIVDMFASLQIGPDGEPRGSAIASGEIESDEAQYFWSRMRAAGQIDFAALLYLSHLLMQRHPGIANHLASRFAWILVDEFQDTTNLQIDILRAIHARGRTKFYLVGDPFQSIYGFAGADPGLADQFAADVGARNDLSLSGNFRSAPAIVDDAELICPREPRMDPIGPNRFSAVQTEYVAGASTFDVVQQHFLPRLEELEISPGEAAVLAPNWFTLYPLGRMLRQHGVPIVGPGARPYRRSHLFAVLAERICGFLTNPEPSELFGIERALFDALLQATGKQNFGLFTYDGRRLLYRLLAESRRIRQAEEGAVNWLRLAARTFSAILVETGFLSEAQSGLLEASVSEMETDIRSNRLTPADLTVEDLGLFGRSRGALRLLSLHASKGREFEAVLMIDLHEGRIPFYTAATEDEFAAAQRLFYVGVTRAKQFLMYATDQSDRRNRPTRYLGADFLGVA